MPTRTLSQTEIENREIISEEFRGKSETALQNNRNPEQTSLAEEIFEKIDPDRTSAYPRQPSFAQPQPQPELSAEQIEKRQKSVFLIHMLIQLLLLRKYLDNLPKNQKQTEQYKRLSNEIDKQLQLLKESPELTTPLYEKTEKFVEETPAEKFQPYFDALRENESFRELMQKGLGESPQFKPLVDLSNEQRFGVTASGEKVIVANAHDVADIPVVQQGPAIGSAPLDEDTRLVDTFLGSEFCTQMELGKEAELGVKNPVDIPILTPDN